MTDFRKADISKQESYDLLRDWIKLVARHTNPDQDISELLGWLWKLKPATPDPITGLVPCGCGGKPTFLYSYVARDDECCLECPRCGAKSALRLGEERARDSWNTAMGWRKQNDKR